MAQAGERRIAEICVIGDGEALCTPCGGCRQRIREFADAETLVHVADPAGVRRTFRLPELLPESFGPGHLPGMTPERDAARRPLRNRVDPFGEFHAVAERGAMMGNRGGRIHRDDRTLGSRRWASKRWLICRCDFRGRRRDVWGRFYTELFFLDEPTALAAGHRPCFECRRAAAKAFQAAFPGAPGGADAIDDVLHRERLADGGGRLWRARLGALPDGTMILWEGRAHALKAGQAEPWSFAGYGAPFAPVRAAEVEVLTPPSTVAALASGYRPEWPRTVAA